MPEGIHIVSFDVPFPPDYGGVIDVYYKAKALADLGIKVKLHCFAYGRSKQSAVAKDFDEVIYYERKLSAGAMLSKTPFIVKTRKSQELLDNLLKNDWPILFEGLHTCAWLDHPKLKDRFKIVRTHNIEHDYYARLGRSEKSVFRKQYFKAEAKKLRAFEKVLTKNQKILAISQGDQAYFEKKYGKTDLIYPFHPEFVMPRKGKGDYAFYHGKLEVSENQEALDFLVNKVFSQSKIPLVVAGKGSEKDVAPFRNSGANVTYHLNPNAKEMKSLSQEAGVHVLPTFQTTGFKLKLLYSLQNEVEVIVNEAMVKNTGLENLVTKVKTPEQFRKAIKKALISPLSETKIKKRKELLELHYSNSQQAKRIIDLLD
ncbi:glycosyltransferase [Cryomorphaceae bacterium 1068]|nr:glycosyltransferase [Cryomorphaceae bacterium 1068]